MSVRELRCRECGRTRPLEPAFVCEYCFGPLEVIYDYAALRGRLSPASIAAGPSTIWRYADLLPASAVNGDLGTGFTPLSQARNLGRQLGLLILAIIFGNRARVLSPAKIDAQYAWLKGAGPDFLNNFSAI